MKSFVIFLFCFVAYSVAENYPVENVPISFYSEIIKLQNEINNLKDVRGRASVNINDYLDKTMIILQKWIVRKGLDPLEVEDMGSKFSQRIGLITISGELTLNHGWLQGLGTAQRGGEAKMNYEAKFLNIRLPLAFQTLHINYDYKAQLIGLGPKGGVEGKVKNIQLLVDVTVDTTTMEIILQTFRIVDAGRITVKFSGNPLVDWLTNILTDVATTLLHDLVTGVLEHKVRDLVEEAIDQINESIQPNKYYVH